MTSKGYTTNLGQVDNSRTFALEGGPSRRMAYPVNLLPEHKKLVEKVIKKVKQPSQGDKLQDPTLRDLGTPLIKTSYSMFKPKVPKFFE